MGSGLLPSDDRWLITASCDILAEFARAWAEIIAATRGRSAARMFFFFA
jgi:hypothetical protein